MSLRNCLLQKLKISSLSSFSSSPLPSSHFDPFIFSLKEAHLGAGSLDRWELPLVCGAHTTLTEVRGYPPCWPLAFHIQPVQYPGVWRWCLWRKVSMPIYNSVVLKTRQTQTAHSCPSHVKTRAHHVPKSLRHEASWSSVLLKQFSASYFTVFSKGAV